jgi:hypothetical protein
MAYSLSMKALLHYGALALAITMAHPISTWASCCLEAGRLQVRHHGDGPFAPHVDSSVGWGHAFDLFFELSYNPDLSGGQCQFEWWETADYIVPGLAQLGMEPDIWYDHRVKNSLSPMWENWDKGIMRLGADDPNKTIRITDYPALGLTGVQTVLQDDGTTRWVRTSSERRLRIQAIVRSGSPDCPVQDLSFAVRQDLKVIEGRPAGGRLDVLESLYFPASKTRMGK